MSFPFINQYQLPKTLRFELIPEGKTLEHIQNKGLLQKAQHRAESYKKVKKVIDGYHKHFIEKALSGLKLNGLEDYSSFYYSNEKSDTARREIEAVSASLRKQVAERFSKNEDPSIAAIFENLFSKELIKEDLLHFASDDDKDAIQEFNDFTTYFTGFHNNRKNIYTQEEKSTAVAYRLIHENLPKFFDNIKSYEIIKRHYPQLDFRTLEDDLEELLQGTTLSEIFTIEYFNVVLTQEWIGFYNTIIGGRTAMEGKKKIKGLNEYINQYCQQHGLKLRQLPKFKQLYKQILSDRESLSFLPENYETDHEVLESIATFYQKELCEWEHEGSTLHVLKEIKSLMEQIAMAGLDRIFIRNDASLSNISQQIFGEWSVISSALDHYYETNKDPLQIYKGTKKKYDERKEKWVTKSTHFSVAEIEASLHLYKSKTDSVKNDLTEHPVCEFFTALAMRRKDADDINLTQQIETDYLNIKDLLNGEYPEEKNLGQNKEQVAAIKSFLDSIKDLLHFMKPLHPEKISSEKDEVFYSRYTILYEQLERLTPLYNKVRNYLTRKPYSTEKVKLRFENKGDFLGGWVDSSTESSDNGTQSGGYLFRKKNDINEYDYYLGISNDKKLFRSHKQSSIKQSDKSNYERLDYYQLKTASIYGNSYVGNDSYETNKKNLANILIDFANRKNAHLFHEINNHFQKDSSTPSSCLKFMKEKFPDYYLEFLKYEHFKIANEQIIEDLKNTLSTLSRVPKAEFYATKNYVLFNEVISDIELLSQEKAYSYFPVSNIEFEEATDRGEKPLLLFKITNKDLSFATTFQQGKRKKRGAENMHTLYFRQLMSGNQNVFDIGTGEVFFRDETKDLKRTTAVHYKKVPIKNKNVFNTKAESDFDYDIIKDKRFTERKYFFHLSTILNYQHPKKPKNYDERVRSFLKNNPSINIIGIDRGERHLLYVTLIDQEGNIKKQYSLNEIINRYKDANGNDVTVKTNYHDKLHEKEGKRMEARKSWGLIENIKELKEGYLSQVVHQICKLMVEHNAIVVMEDLNAGFKRGRQKVEKQVYQKFEKMLIDKLNYLVFKDKAATELGGVLNALQLSSKFDSFKNMGKQSGFIFYVPAALTSKIDPATGFVNFLLPKYESVEKAKEFFKKFDSIVFNKEKKWFEFLFDYNNFTTKADGTKTKWTVCTTDDIRYHWNRNKENTNGKGGYDEYNVTEKLETLFVAAGINYPDGKELKDLIPEQSGAEFYRELTKMLAITLSLRHNNGKAGEEEEDFILSPVTNEAGLFYNSLKAPETMPQNADANGAYNIALKGRWILEQINNVDDLKKVNLAISNKEWLQFAQQKAFALEQKNVTGTEEIAK